MSRKYILVVLFLCLPMQAMATSSNEAVIIPVVSFLFADSEDEAAITHHGVSYGSVVSPHTGRTWLDRNLGASKVCEQLDEEACYGYYYQWGRNHDGHQLKGSATTFTLASGVNNTDAKFILYNETGSANEPFDWVANSADATQRRTNWSKTDGSSVCPVGYRVPTRSEIKLETIDKDGDGTNDNTDFTNNVDAFNSFLKLPSSGYRKNYTSTMGEIGKAGEQGQIYSSTINGGYSCSIVYKEDDVHYTTSYRIRRAKGAAVRCIKAVAR